MITHNEFIENRKVFLVSVVELWNMHKCCLCIDKLGGRHRGMFCFACAEHDLCDFSPSANSVM